MFEVICPKCRERVRGPNEQITMREYSWHWINDHEDPAPDEEE